MRRSPVRWFHAIAAGLILLFAAGIQPASAAPCEPPPEGEASAVEQLDAGFKTWVVTPLETVLFFDLVFWDNTLAKGETPSKTDPATLSGEALDQWMANDVQARGAELRAPTDDGYAYRCRLPARRRDATPVLGDNATVTKGILNLTLREDGGRLLGGWGEVPVDPVALGLVPAEGTDPEAPRPGDVRPLAEGERELVQVGLDAIAPFPVVIDLTNQVIRPGEVELPWSELPIEAGSRVTVDGVEYEVASAVGTRLGLRSLTDEIDEAPLANPKNISLPLILVWLILGAVFFTFRFSFINLRAFWHAIMVTAGRYDHADDPGEVSHFQALSSALSATVGLGNIAGVAVAVTMGGPGAVVWMVIAALFGMTSKFTEVTLGQMYRVVKADGTVSGGPMHYLHKGLKEMGLGGFGMVLAVVFSIMAVGGSLGGGNMFQGNQSFQAIADVAPLLQPAATGSVVFERLPGTTGEVEIPEGTVVGVPGGTPFATASAITLSETDTTSQAVRVDALKGGYDGNVLANQITEVPGLSGIDDLVTVTNPTETAGGGTYGLFYGIILTLLVGAVIVGGIKRIGATAGVIVPLMGIVYVLAGIWIIGYVGITSPGSLGDSFGTLLSSAFSLQAGLGGLLGVMIQGFRRAAFSNEAGVGSASIAHSAAATSEPVREGVVALLEPFIDTVIVCTITGLVVVVTGAYQIPGVEGISMTSAAFEAGGLPGAKYILAGAVTLFAFSTMISWSYYGERAATWMLGDKASLPYKLLFLLCVALGPVLTLDNVIAFSDLMILGMAFPNILGLYVLSNKVGAALKAYMGKLKRGEFDQAGAAAK